MKTASFSGWPVTGILAVLAIVLGVGLALGRWVWPAPASRLLTTKEFVKDLFGTPVRGALRPGIYYINHRGFRIAIGKNGAIQLDNLDVRTTHLFSFTYRPEGKFGVPSVQMYTCYKSGKAKSPGQPRRINFWTDVGLWGRIFTKFGLYSARPGGPERYGPLILFDGKWVSSAGNLHPPYFIFNGVKYLYDKQTGGWSQIARLETR